MTENDEIVLNLKGFESNIKRSWQELQIASDFCDVTFFTDDNTSESFKSFTNALGGKHIGLERIILAHGQEITNTDFWTKFTRIVSASESIRSVKVTDVLGDAGLEVLASEFPSNLESLVVWRCPRVSHEAWFGFSEKLQEAKERSYSEKLSLRCSNTLDALGVGGFQT